MKYADIIAPRWAPKFLKRPYRMLLAHWILKDREYAEYHERLRRNSASFVILDNGAFEGANLTPGQLEAAAVRVRPDELVLQDVRHDASATLAKSWESLQRFQDMRGLSSVMFVPHGKTLEEWVDCLDAWLEVWHRDAEPRPVTLTIGVHGLRVLKRSVHSQQALETPVIQAAASSGFSMHKLGCGDIQAFCTDWLATAHQAGVRSIDTSVPFALGVRGKLLTPRASKVLLGDEEQYVRVTLARQHLIKLNIAIFQRWAATGEAPDEISIDLVRQTCREWRKYWAEGLATVEEVMKSCSFPKGWYAIRSEKRPGKPPKEAGVRPLNAGLFSNRELRAGEDLFKLEY